MIRCQLAEWTAKGWEKHGTFSSFGDALGASRVGLNRRKKSGVFRYTEEGGLVTLLEVEKDGVFFLPPDWKPLTWKNP